MNRLKNAWLVLRGKAYCIPYATHYEAILWEMEGAKKIKFSQMRNPNNFNVEMKNVHP